MPSTPRRAPGRLGWSISVRTLCLIAMGATLADVLPTTPADAASAAKSIQSKRPVDPDSPRIITISIRKQRLRLFDANGEITSSRVSSGMTGFDTPTGVFAIVQKKKSHTSNIYGAAMPFMQRLTWSGIAMHAGVVPGYRASHGCVRLPYSFAQSFFRETEMGGRVVVTKDETRPIEFDHPSLFKPLPTAGSPEATAAAQRAAGGTQVASISATDAFDTKSTLRQLVNLPSYFWFTPALAEAMASLPSDQQRPLTREDAEQRLRDHVDRQINELKTAEKSRSTAIATLKSTREEIRGSSKKIASAKRDLSAAEKDIAEKDRRHGEVQKAFTDYMTGTAATQAAANGASSKDLREAAILREADLEDAILEATHARSAARKAADARSTELAGLLRRIDELKSTETRTREALERATSDIKTGKASLETAKNEVERRRKPISIMVSLKSAKLYVRQGFEPVIEAPIIIHGTPKRFGTHVFTAMSYAENDPNSFDWRLVTAQSPTLLRDSDRKKNRRNKRDSEPTSMGEQRAAEFAAAALESFSIPPEVLDVISELATPGASMIVSDRDLPNHENGKGVEFVVLTR